jgi:hypothetical protein
MVGDSAVVDEISSVQTGEELLAEVLRMKVLNAALVKKRR